MKKDLGIKSFCEIENSENGLSEIEQEDDFKTQLTSENNFKAKVIVVMI